MRPDMVPSATLPDYELPDHENVARRLGELQGDDPMILTLARGHYCPKEHQQHLMIHKIYNGYWFWGRPSFVDLWHDLGDVTAEIRPDWDVAAPGLRQAWDAGEWSPFHGCDRRSPDTMSSPA